MKLKFYTEQVLTVLLVVILLPCAITLLLNSRMSRIYQAIQDETKYISIESGDKTEEISLEEYVLEVTASELPADAQLEAIRIAISTAFGDAPICADSAMPTGHSRALEAVLLIN